VPHILHQLTDTAADFLRANANNHTLWLSILRFFRLLFVHKGLLLPLAASSSHFPVSMVFVLIGFAAVASLELFCARSKSWLRAYLIAAR
jgi:hypothetical protein